MAYGKVPFHFQMYGSDGSRSYLLLPLRPMTHGIERVQVEYKSSTSQMLIQHCKHVHREVLSFVPDQRYQREPHRPRAGKG